MSNSKIKSAAVSALRSVGRTSFSDDGFSKAQIEAISNAIANAIEEYDKQTKSKTS